MLPGQDIPQPEPGGKEALESFKGQLSTETPGDASMMAELGGFTPDTTVRELMGQMGIDVDGPITQLTGFMQQQEEMADPMNKMKAMAGGQGAPQGQPPPQAPPQGMPSSNPLDSLMQ